MPDSPGIPTPCRALVAEDEAIIRMDLVESLTDHGVDVVAQVGNGEDAVRLSVELGPDIVFLDIAMPVRDGLSAAQEIRALRVAPVVMVTAFGQREIAQEAAAVGAMGYLVKPFTSDDVLTAMEIAISRWSEFVQLDERVQGLERRLLHRECVDTAKNRVQQQLGLNEADAYAWLRRQAMDHRITLSEFAERLLSQ